MIVRARAPLRLGLAGGGSDLAAYSDRFGGQVLNVTIDRYAYASIEPLDSGILEFVAADTERQWSGPAAPRVERHPGLDLHVGVYNRMVADFNHGRPLSARITSHSEAPPGSGLGSSSTMVVALVCAYAEWLGADLDEYGLARLAYDIERVDLGLAGGRQDQYAAVFGGLNFMEFHPDRVIVNPLRIKDRIRAELEASLVLYYTGVSRESANIVAVQNAGMSGNDTVAVEAMHRVKAEATAMKEAILTENLPALAASMQAGWESKKRTANTISNSHIEAVYDAALAAGALAGKVSGAGGGGFMMFITNPARRPAVMRKLAEFDGQVFTCGFTDVGAKAWRKP